MEEAERRPPHLLSGLPLRELAQAFLTSPHARVNDLEEQLSGARVEDEDGAVDGLRRQVALKRLCMGGGSWRLNASEHIKEVRMH